MHTTELPGFSAHLRSEARKIATTPLPLTHAVAVIAIGAMSIGAILGQQAVDSAVPAHEQPFMIGAALGRIALILLGVRIAVDEYRHGTAVTTLALAVRRHRIVGAKALVGAASGAVIGLVGQALTFLLASAAFTSKGGSLTFDDRLPLLLLGATIAGAAWVAIGVAVGELVRATLPAVVGALLWVVLLEDLIGTKFMSIRDHLPGNEAYKLVLSGDGGLMGSGALGMAVWAVALGAVAAVLISRRNLLGQS